MSLLIDILAQGHSRKTAQRIAHDVRYGSIPLAEVFDIFYSQDMRSCQHISWALELIAKQAPQMLYPYIPQMLLELDNPKAIAGVHRNTMRIWQFIEIPSAYEGEVLDKAFEYMSNPQVAVAIRVFAMTICTNLAERFPALASEVKIVIEDNWDHSTPGWRSRGKRELKRLEGIIKQHAL